MPVVINGTTGISGVDGSAGTPSYQGGDSNTGIFYPAADVIAFSTSGTEDARFDSAGNFGIGTTSPGRKLHVNGDIRTVNCLIEDSGTNVNFGTFTAGYLGLQANGSERMRIDSSGNVIVGGTSQQGSARLSVVRSSAGESIRITDGATGGFLGTIANVGIQLISGANLLFGSADAERMRIDNSGNLLVGTTATQNISGVNTDHTFIGTTNTNRWVSGFINNSASSPYGLAVSYTGSAPNATGGQFLFCRDTVGTRFEVRSNGGIANYSANDVNLSDEREKTNIQLAGSYLDKICAIPVKTFNYIDQNRETDDGLTLGVIAQDVEKVAPELVMESDWGTKEEPKMRLSIYQTDLQYALMKCIQEQQAMIEELKAKVAVLEK